MKIKTNNKKGLVLFIILVVALLVVINSGRQSLYTFTCANPVSSEPSSIPAYVDSLNTFQPESYTCHYYTDAEVSIPNIACASEHPPSAEQVSYIITETQNQQCRPESSNEEMFQLYGAVGGVNIYTFSNNIERVFAFCSHDSNYLILTTSEPLLNQYLMHYYQCPAATSQSNNLWLYFAVVIGFFILIFFLRG